MESKRLTPREAVEVIQTAMKPGTELRHKTSRGLYVIGTKSGRDHFWILDCARSKKGVVPATQIVSEFEKAG